MQTSFAYVGSYTEPERGGRGSGINVYKVDRHTGAFRHVQRISQLENPSFLSLSADGRHLYSVHGDRTHATSFSVDQENGKLTFLNRQPNRRLQSRSPRLRPGRPLSRHRNLHDRFDLCLAGASRWKPGPLLEADGRRRRTRPAQDPAAWHVPTRHSPRSPRPLLLRALQGRRLRDLLPPRRRARRAGRDLARGGASRRRPAPHRVSSGARPGLC